VERASEMEPSPLWRTRAVGAEVVSEGIHQPYSWGWPLASVPKWTSVKARLRVAGVFETVREGARANCHWLR